MRPTVVVLLSSACVLVFLPWLWAPPAGLLAAILGAALFDRESVRSVMRFGVILAALFAAAVGGAAVAWSAGIERGLPAGGLLLSRLLVLWLVTAVVSQSVDAEAVLGVFRRMGAERLGLVFGLALNALPRLTAAARKAWIAHRVRTGSRWAGLRRLPALAEVLLAHTLKIADEAAGAAALRGHAGLLRPRSAWLECPAPVIVLTGPPGSGKTTMLQQILGRLDDAGLTVAGVIQPGVFESGAKVGFLVRDLGTGEEAPLARRTSRETGWHGTAFRFEDEGLTLARTALESAPRDAILVVDELGPVELRGQGHMPALRRTLASRPPRLLILVVRRHLVPALLAALEAVDARIIDIEAEGERALDGTFGLIGDLLGSATPVSRS